MEWFKEKHTTYWDITNDKKDDKIDFIPSGAEYGTKTGFRVRINGENALAVKKQNYHSYCVFKVSVKGKNYLFLHLSGDSDMGPSILYAYKNKKLVKTINFLDDSYSHHVEEITIKGDKVVAKIMYSDIPGLGGMTGQAVYKNKGFNRFEHNNKSKILNYIHNRNLEYKGNLITKKSIDIYSDYKGK